MVKYEEKIWKLVFTWWLVVVPLSIAAPLPTPPTTSSTVISFIDINHQRLLRSITRSELNLTRFTSDITKSISYFDLKTTTTNQISIQKSLPWTTTKNNYWCLRGNETDHRCLPLHALPSQDLDLRSTTNENEVYFEPIMNESIEFFY